MPSTDAPERIVARAPGRVNLLGDHTEDAGGTVVSMAIDRETIVEGFRTGQFVQVMSGHEEGAVTLPLDVVDPMAVDPEWARYVAGVVAVVRPAVGLRGAITSTVPLGVGLSASASLEVAVALALGADADDPLALARLCRRAEQAAVGLPSGLVDQLAVAAGVEGHVLLVDGDDLTFEPVRIPDDLAVTVVHSAQPGRSGSIDAVGGWADAIAAAPASDIIHESARAAGFADALRSGDVATAGRLMVESDRSLRADGTRSSSLDDLVDEVLATPGVLGARRLGAAFGGCVVAIGRPGALDERGWTVRAAAGASVAVG